MGKPRSVWIESASRTDFPFDLSPRCRFPYSRFMENHHHTEMSLGARLSLAWTCFRRVLASSEFAGQVAALSNEPQAPAKPAPVELPPERRQASGLAVLSLLQREGRLIDFLQEEVASFSDAEVGAAARVVHAGCKKVVSENFTIEPVLRDAEGATVKVAPGFDAQRIRITGNVAGQPPFSGTLKHHGWMVSAIRLPAVSEALDPRVIMAAEVEL
jgi:hypothetical protein